MTKKSIKRIGLVAIAGLVIAASVGTYMFFKPHRNVQEINAYAELKVNDLVNEFTADAASANVKYLANDGNSKVLIVMGQISKISVNQTGEKVIILKDEGAKVGVSATFTLKTSPDTEGLKIGDLVKIKGAITAGNRYDEDLDLYEHAILIQCNIVK